MKLQDSICSRSIQITRADSLNFDDGIETVASTDKPVLVIDWERFEIIREVLPPKYFQPIEGDKVPLLDSHSRFSVENIVGSARNFRAEGNQLLAKTFVSESEPKVRQKINEGHIDSVSIGYNVYRDHTIDVPKGKDAVIDGVSYRNDFTDDIPFVVRTKWAVKELSLVAIGANDAAKFRSVLDQSSKALIEQINELRKEIDELKKPNDAKNTNGESALRERKLKLIDIKLKQLQNV